MADDTSAAPREPAGLFVPGYGATAALYARAMPDGFAVLELPSFAATNGELEAYARWLGQTLAQRSQPPVLAGHSMGAAVAVLAAARADGPPVRLVLVSPAGLPLAKPIAASGLTFVAQAVGGRYPPGELARILAGVARAPRAARRLAHSVHGLDLGRELSALRERRLPCSVLVAHGDGLTTPEHCRRLAAAAGAELRELDARGAHIWPIVDPGRLRSELERLLGEPPPGLRSP